MLFGQSLIEIIYMIPVLLISLSVHEYAHSFVAYKLGDKSQLYSGRMSLNPFAHVDPFGFISILLIGIGWGKPVMTDDSYFKNRSRDNMLVSVAGPLMNLIVALIITLILKVLITFNLIEIMQSSAIFSIIYNILVLTVQFNVIFAVFNLLPLPMFDGGKVLMFFLPYKGKELMRKAEPYMFIVVMILAFTGIASYIISPAYNFILSILEWILNL